MVRPRRSTLLYQRPCYLLIIMSCNSTYKHYQAAADALREAVITALNKDEETNTLSELWRHYLGMRAMSDAAYKDSLKCDDNPRFDQSFWEDDGVSMTGNPGTASSDTISFNFNDTIISTGSTGDTVLGMTYAAAPVDMGGLIGGAGQDTISFA